jgi:hypothetical protein
VSAEILLGQGRAIRRVRPEGFHQAIKNIPTRMASRLAFMSHEHHLVRDYVVRQLPREGSPLASVRIAQSTGLAVQQVIAIVAELEKRLFFLVRDPEGNVSWAFPVTVSSTPHRLTFSSGEKLFGA